MAAMKGRADCANFGTGMAKLSTGVAHLIPALIEPRHGVI
jgi:hypothetical protein